MRKYLNSRFVKNIIDVDFLFLEKKQNVFSNWEMINTKVLNIFEVNESLKQLINLLYFLRSKKNFSIYIWSSDKILNEMILKFFPYSHFDNIIFVSRDFPVILNKENKARLLLVFGTPFSGGHKTFVQKAFINGFRFVYEINLRFDTLSMGSYKLHNCLENYKKLLFVVIIFFQVLKIK